jgi:hypothetical protein
MKIGILTHPQGTNYGGILQCYALCTYLRKLGHEPMVIQRVADKSFFLWSIIRYILRIFHFPRYYHPETVDRMANIRPFINKHLTRTAPIDSQCKMKMVCKKYGLDAVVVGSDQVWRHDYAMKYGFNYFLDFVPDNVVKFSYAASFGLSDWQYTQNQTEIIKQLLDRFKGISVREEDALSLIKDNTGKNAQQLIDPTMLLKKEDYDKITSRRLVEDRYVFVYWLGDKGLIASDIERYKTEGYTIVNINLRDICEQISVEDWLSYIKYADYVITDSFHGCVFSILFERQFIVFGNKSGGNSRIKSLCKMFGFEPETYKQYLNVSSKLEILRHKAENYINNICGR